MTAPAPRKPQAPPRAVKRVATEAAVAHRIELPGIHPPRLNQLMHCHWAVAAKRKKVWTRALGMFAHGIPPATGKRRVTLTITLAPRQRSPDVDAFWKSTLDSLVLCSLLVDDNPKWCELSPVIYLRGPERKTVIVLEDID